MASRTVIMPPVVPVKITAKIRNTSPGSTKLEISAPLSRTRLSSIT